jgi:type I restriction enzyme M protein
LHNPQLGETVLDPAAGTGGFLIETFNHLRAQCRKAEDFDLLQKRTLYGFEAKPMPYLLCQMNMLLHGIEFPQIDPDNALRFPLREIGEKERFDIIMTNPPFGGEEEKGILGNFPEDKRATETALLFLQLIMRRLRRIISPGRAAVIVPNGVLFGTGAYARVKEDLLRDFNLHTIVRLPEGVFAPYAGIPTNILFFESRGPTREIWYYEIPEREGGGRYSRSKPITFEKFASCTEWWANRAEKDQAWKVSAIDIKEDGYNLDRRNPRAKDDNIHVAPDAVLGRVISRENKMLDTLQQIQELLSRKR